jgi:hypothetical protein
MIDSTLLGTASIIIAFISLLVSIFWNQKLQKDQYKIQYRLIFVKEIYPPLAEDIRNSILLIHQYSQNKIIVDNLFKYLRKLYASTQIEFIKSDSPTLFNNLSCIMNEIIPQANNLQIIAVDYIKHISRKWNKYLSDKSLTSAKTMLNNHVERILSVDLFWNLWKGEYNIAELNFDKTNKELINSYTEWIIKNSLIPDKGDFKVLLQYESEEKIIINNEIIKMNNLIKNIIEDKVIPELSKIIAKPIS